MACLLFSWWPQLCFCCGDWGRLLQNFRRFISSLVWLRRCIIDKGNRFLSAVLWFLPHSCIHSFRTGMSSNQFCCQQTLQELQAPLLWSQDTTKHKWTCYFLDGVGERWFFGDGKGDEEDVRVWICKWTQPSKLLLSSCVPESDVAYQSPRLTMFPSTLRVVVELSKTVGMYSEGNRLSV